VTYKFMVSFSLIYLEIHFPIYKKSSVTCKKLPILHEVQLLLSPSRHVLQLPSQGEHLAYCKFI